MKFPYIPFIFGFVKNAYQVRSDLVKKIYKCNLYNCLLVYLFKKFSIFLQNYSINKNNNISATGAM